MGKNKKVLLKQSHLEPVPSPKYAIELAKALDKFYKKSGISLSRKPSEILQGAFWVMREECRSNPDWMAQSAHSFRELLYPYINRDTQKDLKTLLNVIKKYSDQKELKVLLSRYKTLLNVYLNVYNDITILYNKFTTIAHHGFQFNLKETDKQTKGFNTKEEFEKYDNDPKNFSKLVEDFLITLDKFLTLQQIFIHHIIDTILKRYRK